ncbi:BspA family leucine-rich repeat surface protein [uncultured Ruminococcus sp.]|uniref:BspA family leucine-rich repeat surface protein n=1 Tax=uncultured Ruminococcus sp. TaxID=165186 RepID=UPI0025D220D7|nr:BspA family leucine-rich repeat surface protein [uncultured Ruminococcus sp.]
MKKLFSKTVAALLSITCMGSIMTSSFNGNPLFTPNLTAKAEDTYFVSLNEDTGLLTISGNLNNSALRIFRGDKRVKEVIVLKGTVLPEDCKQLFYKLEAEKIDISNADSSNVTDMSDMFCCCPNLKYLNLDNLNTSKVTKMWQTFGACPNLKSINLQSFNTSNVTDMTNMFQSSGFEELDLSSFDTKKVKYMGNMFFKCENLKNVDLSSFNTSNLENMSGMFNSCKNLKSLDFSNFDTTNLKLFDSVFTNCESLEKIIFGNFDTSNIKRMTYMFYKCSKLKYLDLSSFDTSNVEQMDHMFEECKSLERIYVSDEWSNNKVNNGWLMFNNCYSLKGGNGTVYDNNVCHLNHSRAYIDTAETPGYFTKKDLMSIVSFLFENIASEILEPLPDIKSGNGIDNDPLPDNNSNPTNNNSNQDNSTSSDNNTSQNDNTTSNNNNSNNEIYIEQDDIKTCIEKYGTHDALIGYEIPISLSYSKCYILEVCPDQTCYYDIPSDDFIASEIYNKPFLKDYQRIEPVDNNEFKDVYYLECNKTYYIKIYLPKVTEMLYSGYTLDWTFSIYPHVDRINESEKPMMWVSNEASNNQSAFNNYNAAIVYLPKDTVKGFHKAAYCDKSLKQQSDLDEKIVSILYTGINQGATDFADEATPVAVLEAMFIEALKLESIDNVNVWKYIDENAIIESNEYENGIKITRKGNDTLPKSVKDINIEAWYGDLMEGQVGQIGHFIPFQYSDIINHK